MTLERALRWIALAIAVLALIDPPATLSGHVPPRVSVVVQDGPSMTLPSVDGTTTRQALAADVGGRLKRDLANEFTITEARDESSAAFIVLGDRYPEHEWPEAARIATVTLAGPLHPNVRIVEVDAPHTVPPDTAVSVVATVEAAGMAGSRSHVVVHAGGAEIGRTSHDWTQPDETWRAELVAVPVGAPPYRFQVDVTSEADERTDADNHAAVAVDGSRRLRVFVLEARPSWSTAFVRRALESDPRFEVEGISIPAPRAPVTTGGSQSSGRIDRFDAHDVVVVGGLDRLSSDQVAALEHFVADRGGAVAIVPDRRPSGLIQPFLPSGGVEERLLERPARLLATLATTTPALQGSELLELASVPPDAVVLARTPGSNRAVIWTTARGEGRLLFSGAMDAWRFRGDPDGGFDRFWRATIAGLALGARPAVEVSVTPTRAAPGEEVTVRARVRKLERDRLRERLSISARAGTAAMRLWPDAASGVFSGRFRVDRSTDAQSVLITARLGDGSGAGEARVTVDPSSREAAGPPLAPLAATHGGVDVAPGNLAALERHLRSSTAGQVERRPRRPMQSPWWVVPFAACLSAEWWLRRREGRR